MKVFNIIKRNRKYYAATHNGHKCKILIDANSENLKLGEQTILVTDISKKTRYGVDVIYKLTAAIDEQEKAGICTFSHPKFNLLLISRCRNLNGIWDKGANCWVFSELVKDEVENLDYIYNSKFVNLELKATETIVSTRSPVTFLGYPLVAAKARDGGASVQKEVAFISGEYRSGGSYKYWETIVEKNSVFRLSVPSLLLPEISVIKDKFEYKILP